jgi:hypothetical protein
MLTVFSSGVEPPLSPRVVLASAYSPRFSGSAIYWKVTENELSRSSTLKLTLQEVVLN